MPLPPLEKESDMQITATENDITEKKVRLHKLIQKKAFLTRDKNKNEEPFKLASGEISYHYFDVKKITQSPEGIALIADIIYDMIKNYNISGVGGLESSAITISTAVAQTSYYGKRKIPAFWVRKERKEHGTKRLIEGYFTPKSEVVILDDVTTRGSSVEQAVNAVESQGGTVKEIITVVDRQEGAEDRFNMMGIPFKWIFKKSEFKQK